MVAPAGGGRADTSAAQQLYVGVDIAATTFTAAWRPSGGSPAVPFTGEQEPTGNYWVALAVTLHEAGYRVAVVNPRQARHSAKAQRRRPKTDALDARDLARLAPRSNPPWTPPPAVYHEARNQRHALLQWPVIVAGMWRHRDERVAGRDRRVASLEVAIAAVLEASAWAASLVCLTSAPGSGLVTAAWLLGWHAQLRPLRQSGRPGGLPGWSRCRANRAAACAFVRRAATTGMAGSAPRCPWRRAARPGTTPRSRPSTIVCGPVMASRREPVILC